MGVSCGEDTGDEEKLLGLSLWLSVNGFLVSPVTVFRLVLLVRVRQVEDGGPDTGDENTGNPGLVTGGQHSTLSLFVEFVGSKDLLKKIAFFSCCDRMGGGLL